MPMNQLNNIQNMPRSVGSVPDPTLTLSTSFSLQLGLRIGSPMSPLGEVAPVAAEGEAAEPATSVAVAVAMVVAPVENGEETEDGDAELLMVFDWV